MILFLINTSTQLMNAAVLASTEFAGEKCDIYYTENVKVPAERLKKSGIFHEAYQIFLVKDFCERSNVLKRALVRIKNALDINKIKKSLPSNPNQYTCVLASGVSLKNYEIYYAIKAINKKVEICLFEEGVTEYTLYARKNYFKKLFSLIFFGSYYVADCKNLYVYDPGMVNCGWKNINIKKIPRIDSVDGLLDILSRAYGYSKTELDGKEGFCVILEQAFSNVEHIKKQDEIIEMISQKVGKKRVIVKLHPRTEEGKYEKKYKVVKTNIPFELLVLNEKIENNIFITFTSASLLNFKLMFNRFPNILMLNLMLKDKHEKLREYDNMIIKIKESSKNFYVPKSWNEFERTFDNIIEK